MEFVDAFPTQLYCVAHQNAVFCVDAVDGKILWQYEDSESESGFYQIYSMPQGDLLVSSEKKMVRLNREGKQQWVTAMDSGLGTCIVKDDGSIASTITIESPVDLWMDAWRNYQFQRGNFNTSNRRFKSWTYLVTISPTGESKRLAELAGTMTLAGNPGPNGELYAYEWDLGKPGAVDEYSVVRLDP
jgi:hypothetical protein